MEQDKGGAITDQSVDHSQSRGEFGCANPSHAIAARSILGIPWMHHMLVMLFTLLERLQRFIEVWQWTRSAQSDCQGRRFAIPVSPIVSCSPLVLGKGVTG
jgi:hypothetical protein